MRKNEVPKCYRFQARKTTIFIKRKKNKATKISFVNPIKTERFRVSEGLAGSFLPTTHISG